MLSPTIYSAEELMTKALNEILQLDKYATTTNNIVIGKLPKDPNWLASVRSRTAMLGEVGGGWLQKKPDIWSPILVQFTDYATSFGSIAAMQKAGKINSTEKWINLLNDVLYSQLKTAVVATKNSATQIKAEANKFSNIQPLLEESIQQGWSELADEEQMMVKIATELTNLQDKVESLEDKITSGIISGDQSVISSSVKIIYGIATEAGAAFSWFSMATSAYTVGKMYYDIITKTDEISNTLKEIAVLQLEASEEAQAAAGTKMILQVLYYLEKTFLSIGDVMPQITTMWETEQNKIKSVIQALEAGADPNSYFDILTISTANKNWQTINSFAAAIPTIKEATGTPVVLNPEEPISSSN